MRGLAGRTAIVTGASRGIGLGVARRLVEEGARVVITARKPEALAEAVESLGGPEHALGVPGNAADAEHRRETVAAAIATFGSVDLLVNNTGINPAFGLLMDLDLDAARKIMDVNVVAALGWTQEVHRGWMKAHGGSVVNVSSLSGVRPAPFIAMYGASKAALVSLTETLAQELGPGIRVNAVAPAVVKTRFAEALYVGREEEASAAYPLKRLGEPDDIGSLVAFLLSDEASWLTGQTVVADGGIALQGQH
ncbi:SDR family oxidoreductase [Nocardioides dongxiaopingii]|uniref:SDR family oxidoreductase n=1 Tax=Nocardioides sp. S-1144 TaxID=2582905 RepID=UPI00110D7411|nr:SDR family oxidoreductase [Nocardioides sp. S-1144]QCW50092.1 SDR family oxidoreductase [Nocardioides sp. S-1144]